MFLASGSEVSQVCDAILFEDGGYLMPRNSKVSQKIREHLDKLIYRYGEEELTPRRIEKRVYVFELHLNEKLSK